MLWYEFAFALKFFKGVYYWYSFVSDYGMNLG